MSVLSAGMRWLPLVAATLVAPTLVQAQDPTPEQGVRIGITYTPGVRPGMLVLRTDAGALIDSVEAILHRDLDFSDRFEMITLPGGQRILSTLRGGDDTAQAGGSQRFVNYIRYT